MLLPCLLMIASILSWTTPVACPGAKGAVALADGRILIVSRAGGPGARLACFTSSDEGASWKETGEVVQDSDPKTDIGDGNLVVDRAGHLFAVFRRNHTHRPERDYAVEVCESADGGVTWKAHSTVETVKPDTQTPSRGLWAPFLFVAPDGDLQCYFDNENTPYLRGFVGHQWVTMKTYSRLRKRWESPITVARARDPRLLSRDGMAVVIETSPGRLLCAFESVQTEAPHAGLVRFVTSSDGGKTWSDRHVLYEPSDRVHHAFSPWLAKVGGALVALAATNPDRAEPGRSGTPARQLMLDIKSLTSRDGGQTWDAPKLLYGGTHRNYLPGLVTLPKGQVLATWLDFDRGCLSAKSEGF